MKHLLVIAAFVAACCADVGESGHQDILPSKPFPPGGSGASHGEKPSPLGEEIPHGGHGTHRPKGGHGPGFPQRPQSYYASPGSQRQRPRAPQKDVRQISQGGEFNQRLSRPQRPFGSSGSWVGGQGRVGGFGFVSGQNDVLSTPTSYGGSYNDNDDGMYEGGDYSAIPGKHGVDYPDYDTFPETSFSCDDHKLPGYYADVETKCQGFHVCRNGYKFDFLCPVGTTFNQRRLICGWWNEFDCSTAPDLYHLNELLYVTPPKCPDQDQERYPPGEQSDTPQNFPAAIDQEQPGSCHPSGGQSQRPFGGQHQHHPSHNRPSPKADVPHEGNYLPN